MKALLVILLLLIASVAGATTYDSDGTVSDFASKWSGASDGDTVTIPQGTHTWNSGATLSGKGVWVKGLGTGATINGTGNPKLTITHDATHHIILSGLSFGAVAEIIHVSYSASGKSIIVTNCNFTVDGGMAFGWQSVGGGVISRVTCTGDGNYNDQFLQHKTPVNGDDTWTAASTMGSADTTGMVNLYVEDSRFTNCQLQCFDFDDNSRIVVRSNIFVDSAITSHGFSTSRSSTRHWEVYSNLWLVPHPNDTTYPNMDYFFFARGGTGIFRYNNMPDLTSQEWGNKSEAKFQEQQLRRTGESDCPTTYPAPKQLGQSHNGSSSITDPIYIGGNTGAGASSGNANAGHAEDYPNDDCGNGQTMEMGGAGSEKYWRANRDYVLNAIKSGYTIYTYPHPLASGGGGAEDTTDPTIAIDTPTSSATYSTPNATVTVSGTASDDTAVTAVTWSNDRGGSGTATGTTSWSKANIPLFSGVNVITITAVDAAANDATDVITVTRTLAVGTITSATIGEFIVSPP